MSYQVSTTPFAKVPVNNVNNGQFVNPYLVNKNPYGVNKKVKDPSTSKTNKILQIIELSKVYDGKLTKAELFDVISKIHQVCLKGRQ